MVIPDLVLRNVWCQLDIDELLEGAIMHLYKNNLVPSSGTVLGDFTEADYTGYAPLTITGWSAPVMSGVNAITSPGPQDFVAGVICTPNDIYGYYVTDPTDTFLIFAERDGVAPVAMNVTGKIYRVTPTWKVGVQA